MVSITAAVIGIGVTTAVGFGMMALAYVLKS